MATYKLNYFPFEGRGELSRFIFAQAGVKYEDCRTPYDQWPAMKPNCPLGRFPTLEVDGQTICGSLGIARFLAERFGLAGSNDVENAIQFGVIDYCEDIFMQFLKVRFEKDETKKAELVKNFQEKTVPDAFGRFEKLSAANPTPEGWLFGKVTYCDLFLYIIIGHILAIAPTGLDNFPVVTKLRASVEGLENIKKWLEEKPEQHFPPGK